MPAERVAMRKIREVLRLHHGCGLGKRKIAPLVGIGPTAVGDCLRRANEAGLGWPLPDDLDDEALERRLFRKRRQEATLLCGSTICSGDLIPGILKVVVRRWEQIGLS